MEEKYTVEVGTLKEVAFLKVLLGSPTTRILRENGACIPGYIEGSFPGGIEGAEKLNDKGEISLVTIYTKLERILKEENVTPTSAPWLSPQAPTKIDGNRVWCSKSGVTVGCAEVSLEELKLLVKECEGAEE